jgi:hypothetical protein
MLLGAPARHLHLAGAVLLLLLHADLPLHLPQRLEHGLLHVRLVVLQHLVLVVLVQLQQRRAHGLLHVHLVVLQYLVLVVLVQLQQRRAHGLLHVHLVVLQHLVLVVLVQLRQLLKHGLLHVHLVVPQHHDDVHLALHLLQAGLVNGDRSYPQLL